jgi:hypothetical protein
MADFPRKFRLDTSAVLHHRRLIEQYGGWRSQVRFAGRAFGVCKCVLTRDIIWSHKDTVTAERYFQPQIACIYFHDDERSKRCNASG